MSDETVEGLVTLTERTVNLVNQLSMPLVEVSLVIQKHVNQLMTTLTDHLEATGQTVGERVHWSTAMPRSSSTETMASVLRSSSHDQLTLVGIQTETTPSASSIEVQLAASKTTMPPASEFTVQLSPRCHVKFGLSP